MVQEQWLIFLAQLPAAPSSARVALWRRLRAVGAAGVHNGAWILPHSDKHVALVNQLADTVRLQGGSANIFTTTAISQAEQDLVLTRFQSDRAREYDEFQDRARGFFAEIDKETQKRKFTFAELEEIEDDLEKLSAWLGKIRARDFFPDERMKGAIDTLEACGAALRTFAEEVYAQEGVSAPVEEEPVQGDA